ncbi:uncharacterized protein LOC134290183 [Aedes albopictus]|uniref:CCHC-type domain-containing protein n=1 Tax=Aedes albopictus TaxID=7160 RepID=A0ABM1YBQ2_AEDAL
MSLREHSKLMSVTVDAIKTIEKFVDDYDATVDRSKIESRLMRLDQLYSRYETVSIEVELLMEDTTETKATFINMRGEMEERYYRLRDFLTLNKPGKHTPPHTSHVTSSVVRLPKIDLPTFDGEIDNWIPFHDAYRSLIHNNKDLAAVDKFHYLMTALKDPVKRLLDTTSITGDNYKIAWDLLVSRYDNKRLLIKNHISSLFNVELVEEESSDAILALVDHFERHVKILTTLGEPTTEWSSLLVHMLCSRLNHSVLRDWERSTSEDRKKIPTYSELITFLKDQARILLSLNSGSTTSIIVMEKPHHSGAYTAAVSKPLPPKATSRIYDCEEFKRIQLEQKQDTVRRKKLCWNCLGSSHFSRECSSKTCQRCNEKHHTLLHPFSPNVHCPQSHANPPDQYTSDYNDESVISALLSIPSPLASTTTPAIQQPTFNSLAASNSSETSHSTVLLSTAVVKVHGPSGRSTFVRTLLDSCSESNFITERIVQLLGLNRRKQAAVIAGMGGSTVNSHQCTSAVRCQIQFC